MRKRKTQTDRHAMEKRFLQKTVQTLLKRKDITAMSVSNFYGTIEIQRDPSRTDVGFRG